MDAPRLTEIARHVVAAHPAAARTLERRMFGSEAFLVDGNLACGASSRGLMVRVDRDEHDALLARPEATTMEMRGRDMIGWMRVDPSGLDDAQIANWVRRGLDYAASLPPK